MESNHRQTGYEPVELPLFYPVILNRFLYRWDNREPINVLSRDAGQAIIRRPVIELAGIEAFAVFDGLHIRAVLFHELSGCLLIRKKRGV